MNKFIRLAWRNIWRNKRRSLITIAAISFAVVIIAITRSLQYGTYDTMEAMAVNLFNGEIQVHRRGFHQERTLAYHFRQDEQNWQALLDSNPRLQGYTRRITSFGLVSSDSASAGALILGIEPDREPAITQFTDLVSSGGKLAAGDDHLVVMGALLARNLRAGIGDTVVVLTQGYQNQMGADVYVVKGLLRSGQPELDRSLMLMPLNNAQELFSLDDGITQVLFKSDNFRNASRLAGSISAGLNGELEVMSWEQLMPELKQLILMDNVSGVIYLAFIIIVVGIEIFNATMMSVVERTREFGVMQAIGVKPKQIGGLILLESLFRVALSLAAGLILSLIVVSILSNYQIPLPQDMVEAYAAYGFVFDDLKFSASARVYLEPLLSVTVVALIALIIPTYKTYRLSPVEAFRKT